MNIYRHILASMSIIALTMAVTTSAVDFKPMLRFRQLKKGGGGGSGGTEAATCTAEGDSCKGNAPICCQGTLCTGSGNAQLCTANTEASQTETTAATTTTTTATTTTTTPPQQTVTTAATKAPYVICPQDPFDENSSCSEGSPSCTVNTESCCDVTFASESCDCEDGSYICMVTEACMCGGPCGDGCGEPRV